MLKLREKYLGTVSVLALSALMYGGGDARAEQPALILEGQAGWMFGDEQVWAVRFPPTVTTREVSPEFAFEGTLGFVLPSDFILPDSAPEWSVAVFARFGGSNEETEGGTGIYYYNALGGSYPTYYTAGSVKHEEEHGMVDFEARRDVGLGSGSGFNFRTILGARFGYFNALTETSFSCFCDNLNERRNTEFAGFGPRFGFESQWVINQNVAFDLAASGAVLFGRRNTSTITDGGAGGISNALHKSEAETVSMFEGRVGLSFMTPGSPAVLGIGVEGKAWFGIFDQTTNTGLAPQFGTANANRFHVNPYLRLTIPLGVGGNTYGFAAVSQQAARPVSVETRMETPIPIAELEFRGGYTDRSGEAINQSGQRTEDEAYPSVGVSGLAAGPIAPNWIVQVEGDWETRLDREGNNDNYDGGYLAASQLAYTNGNLLLGIFAGLGEAFIETSAGNVEQDTDFWFAGAQGRLMGEHGSLAAQAGLLETNATDPESIGDALFARLQGQFFLNGGNTVVTGDVTYLSGVLDADNPFFPDTGEILTWGVELEHQLPGDWNGNKGSVFVGFQNTSVDEHNDPLTRDDLTDNVFEAGFRIRMGGQTLAERARASAPRVAKFHRLVGTTPALD